MSNIPNNSRLAQKDLLITYFPFTLIILGTVLNLSTFLILCRSLFRDTNKRPTIHYMRVMAIFDTLMLYGWNLDHYLSYAHGFTLQTYSIPLCKILTFLNYFTPLVSAWIRVFICLDQYLSFTRLSKTWFARSKNVFIIIVSIVIVSSLTNLHLLLFACFYRPDGTVSEDGRLYSLYPMWDLVNLGLYNCVPLIFMVVLNSGVIFHLVRLRRASRILISQIKHHKISVPLVVTTFLFLLMTVPASVAFAFFANTVEKATLFLLDSIHFTYHILSFPIYLITFTEFRREVLLSFRLAKISKIQPAF